MSFTTLLPPFTFVAIVAVVRSIQIARYVCGNTVFFYQCCCCCCSTVNFYHQDFIHSFVQRFFFRYFNLNVIKTFFVQCVGVHLNILRPCFLLLPLLHQQLMTCSSFTYNFFPSVSSYYFDVRKFSSLIDFVALVTCLRSFIFVFCYCCCICV